MLFALALRRIGFGGFKLKVLSSNLSLNNLLIFLAFSNHCIRFYLLAFSVFGFSEKRQRFLLYLPLILIQLIKWFLLDLPNKPVCCLFFVFSQETNKGLGVFFFGIVATMRPIFVGNFEYDTRQSELERLFGKYGKIERVDMKSG